MYTHKKIFAVVGLSIALGIWAFSYLLIAARADVQLEYVDTLEGYKKVMMDSEECSTIYTITNQSNYNFVTTKHRFDGFGGNSGVFLLQTDVITSTTVDIGIISELADDSYGYIDIYSDGEISIEDNGCHNYLTGTIAYYMHIGPLYKTPYCTSIYTVSNISYSDAVFVQEFINLDGQVAEMYDDTLPPSGEKGFFLDDISLLPDDFVGHVRIASDQVLSYTLIKCYSGTAPIANMSVMPEAGQIPLVVVFTNTSIGTIDQMEWDFGDGITATSNVVTHTYSSPGEFVSLLSVSNTFGDDSITKTIFVGDDYYDLGAGQIYTTTFTQPGGRIFTDIETGEECWVKINLTTSLRALQSTIPVTITESGFEPSFVTLNTGDSIMWVNIDDKTHKIIGEDTEIYFVYLPLVQK